MNYRVRFSPRHFAIALMLILALLLQAAAYFVFRNEVRRPMPSQDRATMEPPPILDEPVLPGLSQRLVIDVEAYAPIVENNLFSSGRQAWSPPLAETPSPPPPLSAPQPRAPNVRLYGTQVTAQDKIGLFFFGDFSGNNKHRILREGERVWDGEEREGGRSFLVERIEPDMAVLLDTAGRSLEVGLYDHHRIASRGNSVPAPVRQGPQIIMSSPARPPETVGAPSRIAPDGVGEQSGDSPAQGQEELVPELSRQENDHGAPAPLIPVQNHDEMEQLVEEGKMRKIMTPFGPIYRPIPQ